MRIESSTLKKHLSSVKNLVPEELADKLCQVLSAITEDALDSMEEHIKLREQERRDVIAAMDQRDRVQHNIQKAFALIKRNDDYYSLLNARSRKQTASPGSQEQRQSDDEDDNDEDNQMTLEEQER